MINFQDPRDINLHKATFDKIYRCFMILGYRITQVKEDEICDDLIKTMSTHRSFGHETFYYVGDNAFIFTDPQPVQPDDEDTDNAEDEETGYTKSMKSFMETVDSMRTKKS